MDAAGRNQISKSVELATAIAVYMQWIYKQYNSSCVFTCCLSIHRVNLGAFLEFVRKKLSALLIIPGWTVVSHSCVTVCKTLNRIHHHSSHAQSSIGYYGIEEEECEEKDCCWVESATVES